MRKKIIHQTVEGTSPTGENWLDLERLAQVEMTSESEAHPIESALTPGTGPGWQAAQPGAQTIRLIFDQPQRLKRICLKSVKRNKIAPRSSFCVGYRLVRRPSGRFCVSNITSARLAQPERSRTIGLNSIRSRPSNYELCQT